MAENTSKKWDKGLISKIYWQLMQLNKKKKKNNKKLGRRPKYINLQKKKLQMDKKHMERCSTSLIIREMQIKTTLPHLKLVRKVMIKKSTNNKC